MVELATLLVTDAEAAAQDMTQIASGSLKTISDWAVLQGGVADLYSPALRMAEDWKRQETKMQNALIDLYRPASIADLWRVDIDALRATEYAWIQQEKRLVETTLDALSFQGTMQTSLESLSSATNLFPSMAEVAKEALPPIGLLAPSLSEIADMSGAIHRIMEPMHELSQAMAEDWSVRMNAAVDVASGIAWSADLPAIRFARSYEAEWEASQVAHWQKQNSYAQQLIELSEYFAAERQRTQEAMLATFESLQSWQQPWPGLIPRQWQVYEPEPEPSAVPQIDNASLLETFLNRLRTGELTVDELRAATQPGRTGPKGSDSEWPVEKISLMWAGWQACKHKWTAERYLAELEWNIQPSWMFKLFRRIGLSSREDTN